MKQFPPSFFQEISKAFFLKDKLPTIFKKEEGIDDKRLAQKLLYQGEVALLRGDLSAMQLFERASKLDPNNPNVWFREGLAFFEYGDQNSDKKALLLAGKCFKLATKLDGNDLSFWNAWGKALYMLGEEQQEPQYFILAREKFQKALSLVAGQSKEVLAELYWDHALNWLKIGEYSGEAVDLKMAIQAFNTSFLCQKEISADFWHDFGDAYFKMGNLLNENRLILQGIDYLRKSISTDPTFFTGWLALARSFAHLYFMTLNEEFFDNADESFARCAKLSPDDSSLLIDWASLLTESGKLNKDTTRLGLAVEKCLLAYKKTPHDSQMLIQWVEAISFFGALKGQLSLILEAESKIAQKSELHATEPDIWFAYGQCMLSLGIYFDDVEFFELAIEKFQIGLSLNRNSQKLWHAIAFAHKKIGEFSEDETILDRTCKFYIKAIECRSPKLSAVIEYARLLLSIGEIKGDKEIVHQAIQYFEKGLSPQTKIVLNNSEWVFDYARALLLLGDYSDEEEYYYKAIEIFHHLILIGCDLPHLHYFLALTMSHLADHTLELKTFQVAISFFKMAVKKDAEDDLSWLEWGLTLIAYAHQMVSEAEVQAFYAEAEEKIKQAGQLGNLQAYYHLACLCSLKGQYEDAMRFIEKAHAVEVLPDIEELLQDEWLENLRSTELFANFLAQLMSRQKQSER